MLRQFCRIASLLAIGAAAIALFGCGGGGGDSSSIAQPPSRLSRLPLQRLVDAAQAPIVDLGGTLHVGADVAPPAVALDSIGQHGEIAISHGRVRDGVGADELIDYLTAGARGLVKRFGPPATVAIMEGTTPEFISETVRAVQLINAALPHNRQVRINQALAPVDVLDPLQQLFTEGSVRFGLYDNPFLPDTIIVRFAERADWIIQHPDERASGIASSSHALSPNRSSDAFIEIDPTPNVGPTSHVVSRMAALVHEMIHALGFIEHVDPARFPDSIMGGMQSALIDGHVLQPLDREGLLATYSRLLSGTPADQIAENLGPWNDTSVHLRWDIDVPGGNVAFGVASRNGLAQPWAFGPTPRTDLANSSVLSEAVTWSGRLLGTTPALEPVAGAADLAVALATLDGRLDFTDLESWGANARPGTVGSGRTWGSGDLQYLLNVRGNTFAQTGGDQGTITGAFFGRAHDAMGGVLQRTDLTAAFGGTR